MLNYDSFSTRVLELLEIPQDKRINPYAELYGELGFDSLQGFQIIVISERLADIDVPPFAIPEIYTMQDAYDYYRSLKAT
jgi:acyl carrier protein